MKFGNVVCICLALAGGAYAPNTPILQKFFGGKTESESEVRTYTRRSPLDFMFGRKKESGPEPDFRPLRNGKLKNAGVLNDNTPLRTALNNRGGFFKFPKTYQPPNERYYYYKKKRH